MYKEHPVFQKPRDENAKIWRYMDFTKFVSLVDRKALFFSRADKLPDKFEGSYSKANIELRPTVYKNKIPEHILRQFAYSFKEMRKFFLINSWHLSECESAAMWKLYLRSDEGIAIQSTFTRLTKSFDKHPEDDIHVGKVKYIDYETDWLPEGNLFYPFLHKRKSFQHEQELRAIIVRIPYKERKHGKDDLEVDLKKEVVDVGVYVNVELDVLSERVYVSPTAQEWFNSLVDSILRRYEIEKKIEQSSLAKGPLF